MNQVIAIGHEGLPSGLKIGYSIEPFTLHGAYLKPLQFIILSFLKTSNYDLHAWVTLEAHPIKVLGPHSA
jgi:hypothetical protein